MENGNSGLFSVIVFFSFLHVEKFERPGVEWSPREGGDDGDEDRVDDD